MPDFLENIVAYKKEYVQKRRAYYDSIKANLEKGISSRYGIFKERISKPDKVNLIAEIKKASPSKGLIRTDFDLPEIAKIYAQAYVDAISVLTEDKYFLGKSEYLRKVGEVADVPLLAKDFFIDEGQIYEARFLGASAILLIAAILDDATMKNFIQIAFRLDLDCLVEVHDEDELKRVLENGAQIIGVNNRDLKTFDVNLDVSEKLIPLIPSNIVKVAESGIRTHQDILRLKKLGVNAVLIGETFMREKDMGGKIREVMGAM